MPTQTTDLPKILIVGTLPYNPNESSRALDTYFHNFPSNKLRMIFSNHCEPFKGHCESLFQIYDGDLLKNYFNRKHKIGKIYTINNLSTSSSDFNSSETVKTSPIYKIFSKKNSLRYYFRKFLWNKKRWCTNELEQWVKEFSPEAIYICFSDDYFILEIGYYFAKKFNIPIIAQIGDDYYFKEKKYISPLMIPYFKKYKKLFNDIMNTDGFGVYISKRISDLYNKNFKKQGFPIYLSSNIESNNKNHFLYNFNYFGKINYGRSNSLMYLGDALNRINREWKINVYATSVGNKIEKKLTKHNCICKKPVSYEKVIEIMNSGSFNIIASGFRKKDIVNTKYSLSTKIADSLASSGPILAIGNSDDGAINYLKSKECCIVIDKIPISSATLKKMILNNDLLHRYIVLAKSLFNNEWNEKNNRCKFENECIKLIK